MQGAGDAPRRVVRIGSFGTQPEGKSNSNRERPRHRWRPDDGDGGDGDGSMVVVVAVVTFRLTLWTSLYAEQSARLLHIHMSRGYTAVAATSGLAKVRVRDKSAGKSLFESMHQRIWPIWPTDLFS